MICRDFHADIPSKNKIPKNLRKGGTLILSGIIESKLAQVKDAYAAVGLTLREQLRKGEWFALAFQS